MTRSASSESALTVPRLRRFKFFDVFRMYICHIIPSKRRLRCVQNDLEMKVLPIVSDSDTASHI